MPESLTLRYTVFLKGSLSLIALSPVTSMPVSLFHRLSGSVTTETSGSVWLAFTKKVPVSVSLGLTVPVENALARITVVKFSSSLSPWYGLEFWVGVVLSVV